MIPTPPAQQEYIITEEQLQSFQRMGSFSNSFFQFVPMLADEIRSHPLSDELESAYKNGFNDGQAEGLSDESKAHKDFAKNYFAALLDCDCQVCIDAREAHDTAIRKAERERVLDKLRDTYYMPDVLQKIRDMRGEP